MLANIYLNALDRVWERKCRHLGQLVRYADDGRATTRGREVFDRTEVLAA
jgi:retron-type reverse transcriptase